MLRPRELSRSITLFAARAPTLPPATHTNSYAIGGRDVVLVEPSTPYEDEQRAWLDWARALASQGRAPVAILATHHHPDHTGGIDVFAAELGVPVWVHGQTAARLPETFRASRTLGDGDAIVLDGPVAERWEVLHTPGHAPGHVCLWEPRTRTLVVGDMVASIGTILIAPGDGDMALYMEQLERLALLDARLALPAHGEPVDDPTALFRRYVRHRTAREAKIFQALYERGAEGGTPIALVASAYDDTQAELWPLAVLSLEAHLGKLVAEGRAARHDARYVATAPGEGTT